jgi:hypothetical protein
MDILPRVLVPAPLPPIVSRFDGPSFLVDSKRLMSRSTIDDESLMLLLVETSGLRGRLWLFAEVALFVLFVVLLFELVCLTKKDKKYFTF